MRVFGDLDERESHEPNDLLGSRAAGRNGNHEEQNSSHAAGEEPAMKDRQAVEPREERGSGAQVSEKGQSNAFAGGLPPANPAAQPRGGGQSGKRVSDRIGEQILEPAGDTIV